VDAAMFQGISRPRRLSSSEKEAEKEALDRSYNHRLWRAWSLIIQPLRPWSRWPSLAAVSWAWFAKR